MRGKFAPGCGDIKPNTLAIRRDLPGHMSSSIQDQVAGDLECQSLRDSAWTDDIDREERERDLTTRLQDCDEARRWYDYVKCTEI